ncbi:hypothetical protein H1230_18730 [Paenibacillus sp. 19GGS1-52]|uniref:hypothetical protein n=1 Tax=Paenibacillus sp. 19GGS1-52 TaxID=2758563 RepID=UPI001EFC1987|nr:hypothetical protein [Paenibacillus sp. 19GGS1-52]ULO05146.1 hypothetical protein H1230_18730 [Paenibacillus sp. 19GGS1-52]
MTARQYKEIMQRLTEIEWRLDELLKDNSPAVEREDGKAPWPVLRAQLKEQLIHVEAGKQQQVINALSSLIRCATGIPRIQRLSWQQLEIAQVIINAALPVMVKNCTM